MIKNTKAWISRLVRSMTILFNTIMGSLIMSWDYVGAQVSVMKDYLTPENYKMAAISVIIGNILLRFKTNTALKDK